MHDFWLGAQTGFMLALPVGPVVLLLIRAFLMKGWKRALYSSFFVSCAVSLHMFVGCMFFSGIKSFVDGHVRLISFIMGFGVCVVAYRLRISQNSVLYEKNSLYYPAILSLVCPFTTTILLSLLLAKCSTLDMSLPQTAWLSVGSFFGSFFEYIVLMLVLQVVAFAAPEKVMLKAASNSYILVGLYGLMAIIKSLR